LLKVDACGLCGSDLRTLRHGHREVALPWIIGHEICGTVVELGRDCGAPWSVGDALSVGPLVFCGECDFCVRGEMELCEDYREIAQAWHGGFAEYVAIPGEAVERGTIRPVPSGLDPAVAAIAEPVSSCIHAQEKGRVGLGDTVAILGTGPIGCTHICLAGVHGADRVIAADINDARLELAEQFGPDHTINAERSDLVAEVRRLTDGQGADVVVTANPAPVSQVQAVEMARKGGRILLFGGLPKDGSTPGIDTNLIHYNALTVMGTTIFAPRHQIAALRLLRDGRIPGDRLVTHRLPLAEFRKGVELAFKGEVLKAVFLP
ncbi:MAG: alcohol dehydrogenase catalytic domain-containing protein, partial [Candidatus Brocadiaceae bacterium]